MEDTLINFETAKLAKEKDFNILQHSYYFEDGEFKENSLKGTNGYYGEEYEFNLSEFNENWNDKWLTKKTGDRCFGCSKQKGYLETFSAPTQSLLQRWLREVHNCFIDILPHRDSDSKNKQWKSKKDVFWSVEVDYYGKDFEIELTDDADFTQHFNKSYEEALEIGLYQALKLIK